MKYRFLDQIVGVFLVVTLVLLIISLVFIGGGKGWFRQYDPYYAVFREGYGLQPGSRVEMLNIEIGKVTSIEIDESNQVQVSLKLLESYADKVRADSLLTVTGTPILGTSYLSLTPGSPSAPPLPKDSRIPSEDKKSITDYLEYVRSLELEEKFETATRIMENVAQITERLKEPEGPLFGPLHELHLMLGHLKRGEGALGRILREDGLYVSAEQSMAEAAPLLANLRSVSGELVRITVETETALAQFGDVMDRVSSLLATLQPVVETFPQMTEDVRHLLRSLPPVVQSARRTMDDAGEAVGALKRNPLVRMGLPAEEPRKPLELDLRGGRP